LISLVRFSRTRIETTMRRLLVLVGALLIGPGSLFAQDSSWNDDLLFVESLRARNDNDLALQFLERMALARDATPEQRKELPLEFAKTRLRVAADEPESGKRLELYRRAREDFAKFIMDNPGHPRSAEANLDIARVLHLQGKTELNRAFLNPDREGKQADAAKARATLEDAAKRLAAAQTELETLRGKLPDPETVTDAAARKKVTADIKRADQDIDQTKLDRALNLFDRAQTYIIGGDKEASALLLEAIKILQPLTGLAATNPIRWKATAWYGRCLYEVETADKARAKFQEVLTTSAGPVAAEGQRK
jgi:hypothetical protein